MTPSCLRISFAAAVLMQAALAMPAFAGATGEGASSADIRSRAAAADAPARARWPANETMRAAMLAIRKALLDNHTLITHRRMPPEMGQRFSAFLTGKANEILAASDFEGEALSELKALMRDIIEGAAAAGGRQGGDAAIDGVLRIDAALAAYPERFDHPGWQPLR